MTECSICGLVMLHDDVEYYDGQLVACADGHVAQVSIDCGYLYVRNAEPVSEWVARMAHAFRDRDRKNDVRVIAYAVRQLERDARLGAAVRAAVEDVADDRISGHVVSDDAPDRIYIGEDQLDVLRAIDRVLREEAP